MNRELVAKVRDRIAEVGNEHCHMASWVKGNKVTAAGEAECETTACIGGWAIAIHRGKLYGIENETSRGSGELEETAVRLLDLDRRFFHASYWPARFQVILRDEGDAKGMLAILDALLDGDPEVAHFNVTENT